MQHMIFPCLPNSSNFLEEFDCELSEYDDITRVVRYTYPDTMHCLHATNNALTLAAYVHSRVQQELDENTP